jgi:transposase-like protein
METQKYPVAETDYPRTFQEFDIWFASEENCLQYVAKLRWPDGFRCPACGVIAENPSLMERGLYLCRQCKHQTSITAGTLFHKTHKPLRIWFLAMWFVTSQKHGASALGLKRVLGLGSYNTAWEWLHKLRRGMVRPGRDQLKSPVEVDETYIGGVGAQIRGRGAEGKTIVAIAAEIRGKGPGRIRMAVVPDVSSESLHTFIEDNVQMGSEVRTDGWSGYKGLEDKGYRHKVINIAASGDPAHVVMPRVHRVASLFSRVWLGTHQGAIRPPHLAYYLDEFTFRFNRRNSKTRGLLFYRLMEQAVDCAPAPRKILIGGQPQPVVRG